MTDTFEKMLNDLIDGYENGVRDTTTPQHISTINFNDFFNNATYEDELKNIKLETWKKILQYFGDQSTPIKNFPNPNSLFGHIANKIDGANQLPSTVWNISVNNAIQTFNTLFGENGQIKLSPDDVEGGRIKLEDVRSADAGFSFKEDPYVRPNSNIDDETYLQVRNNDQIDSVLQNQNEMQFTHETSDEPMYITKKIYPYCLGAGQSTLNIYADYKVSGRDFDEVYEEEMNSDLQMVLDFWGLEKEDYKSLIDEYGVGAGQALLTFYTGVVIAENDPDECRIGFLTEKDGNGDYLYPGEKIEKNYTATWIRLLMPKYLRTVEVEDLNRNFWVIGQVVSAICSFLFGNNGLSNLLETLLKEIVGLWENVLYLWASLALLTEQSDGFYHCEVVTIPNNEFQIQKKFDFFAKSNESILNSNAENCKEAIIKRIYYLRQVYPKQNLIIIPEIRTGNYKHNFYSKVIYPGVYLYHRKTNKSCWMWFNVQYNEQESAEDMIPITTFTTDAKKPLIIDLEQDSKNYNLNTGPFYLDHIYGIREEEIKYKYIYPYVESFDENDSYFSLLRVVPDVEVHYGIDGNDTFKITFKIYDAAKKAITGDDTDTLLFTYETDNIITNYYDFDSCDLIATNNYKEYSSGQATPTPIETDILSGYYTGELVSYWNIAILDNYENYGVAYQGTPLPKSGAAELLEHYEGF